MNPATTVPVCVKSLKVPGARLHYEVRGQGPLVMLVGSPMDATSFAPLADLLAADHTVLTTDPRGSNRSPVEDPERDSTPRLRADDLARLLTHLDAGQGAVLGSSGGAVSALALVQAHPELVHTVIAHEAPIHALLDDREALAAGVEDMIVTYLSGDRVGAWAKFLAGADITLPEGAFEQMSAGEPEPRRAAEERFFFVRLLRGTTQWQPDISALRAAPTRIVVGIGDDSDGQLCDRTSTALAAALGIEPTMFPGGHTGFVEDPDGFATRLRAVLHGN